MTGEFYALKLDNGMWLKSGGPEDPVNKVASDVQNAKLYSSLGIAKGQQTEFIKNRKANPNISAYQHKCEVIKLEIVSAEVAMTDKFQPRQTQQQPVQRTRAQQPVRRENKGHSLVKLIKEKNTKN